MTQLLLDYIKSMRIADCMYGTYASVDTCLRPDQQYATLHFLLASQKELPETCPEIYQEVKHGDFSIKGKVTSTCFHRPSYRTNDKQGAKRTMMNHWSDHIDRHGSTVGTCKLRDSSFT